jgi:lipopolysaccharide transport system ATP-binding protein
MTQQRHDELVIRVDNLGKCYRIYDSPKDRLKQALWRDRRQYFREFWALRNVSLEVRRGETLGIIGRNGSGKSTLLQMICGTLTPTEGSVQTHGTVAALLELGSGFNPEFTGIENVYLNALLHGLSREQTEERLEDIQAFADIGEFIHQPVRTYSSGMLVRLAFAVIAHVDASVLIVDEALSVGDAVFGQRCMRFIRRFKETGTLLFVSHDMNAVSSLCEKAVWINSGHARLNGDTATILTAYTRYCFESAQAEMQKLAKAQTSQERSEIENIVHPTRKEPKNVSSLHTKQSRLENTKESGNQAQAELTDWDLGRDYGNGHALITEVLIINQQGQPTTSPQCGEIIRLRITSKCQNHVENFMAGFIVRNRTGMIIWGENNILSGTPCARPEEVVVVSFEFAMPFLSAGTYSISAAISEGDHSLPIPMHYKPDLISIEPLLGERIVHGVFAIRNIAISTEANP